MHFATNMAVSLQQNMFLIKSPKNSYLADKRKYIFSTIFEIAKGDVSIKIYGLLFSFIIFHYLLTFLALVMTS